MRVLDKAVPERGLDTILGVLRGVNRTEDALELLLEYVGARWDGVVLFRRDGDKLAPWLGAGVLHPRGLDELLVPVEEGGGTLARLGRRAAMMTGRLRGTETDELVARLLIGNPYCEALAVSIPVATEVRYVLFACREGAAGSSEKSEHRSLVHELAEKLTRLEARSDEDAA